MKNYTSKLLLIVAFLFVQTTFLKAQFNEIFSETIIDTRTLEENSYLYNIMAKFGDYDNDGDLDILALECIVTETDSTSFIYIYNNQNNIFIKNIELALIHKTGDYVDWFDYDNDGDLDIVFSGSIEAENVPITKIFQNTGNGFVEVFKYDLAQVMWGSMDFGDYDNDGDLDILLTGRKMIKIYEEYEHVTKIYQNTGNGFNEVFDIIGGVGQADWVDFNNDGKLDILFSGIDTYFNNVAKLYFNTGSGFTEVYAGSIAASYYNSFACSDYDNDGDIDILLGSKLYQNSGSGFSEVYNGTILGNPYSTAWGDYDNDGDLDVILSGSNIYRNDGNGFSKINIDILNSFSGSSCWGDYDNDEDLDFLNFDFDENKNIILRIFRNITEKPNIPASAPANPNSSVSGANVTLKWNKATDTETPQNGLSYNIFVYKDEPKSKSRKLVAKTEKIQYSETGYSLKNLAKGTYYWKVQAFDAGLAGGSFSIESSFIVEIPDVVEFKETTNIGPSGYTLNWESSPFATNYKIDVATDNDFVNILPAFNNLDLGNVNTFNVTGLNDDTKYYCRIIAQNSFGSSSNVIDVTTCLFSDILLDTSISDSTISMSGIMAKWGDYDNDGDLDILTLRSVLTETDSISYIHIFNNQNNVFIKNLELTIMHIWGENFDLFDYDNDGDLDILYTGLADDGLLPVIKILKNSSGVFTEVVFENLIAAMYGSITTGDYNNDGNKDILLTGYSFTDQLGYFQVSKIYQNTGTNFIEVLKDVLYDIAEGDAAWADFNNDGSLDIVLTGWDNKDSKGISKIYNNNGNGFTEIYFGSIEGLWLSSIACSDYNNDGYVDLFISGYNGYSNSFLYQNTGSGFTEVYNGTFNGNSTPSAWGDYNNDGNLDLILSGSNIYRNDGNGFTKVYIDKMKDVYGGSSWGDYDNDGDLDFLMSGRINDGSYYLKIYNNLSEEANKSASPPANPNSTVSGANVTLTWNKATDTETPQNGLSYNIFVYKDEPKSKSRKLVAKTEKIQYSTSGYTLKNLANGIYYWKVQAFDTGLKGGDFSEEKSFTIESGSIVTYLNAAICEGESYLFVTQELFDSGDYSRILQAANGSDSTVFLTLTVNPIYDRTESSTLCSGESFLFPDGTEQINITSPLVYTSNLQTVLGCDSIIETTILLNPTYNISDSYSVNSGSNVIFPDGYVQDNITSQFIHISYLQSIYGCDSIIHTTVNVNCDEVYNYSQEVNACVGDDYTFPDGTIEHNVTSQIIHVSNLVNIYGCDSIVETTVHVFPLPIPEFSYECDSTKVLFINESLNSDFYFWDFGDGATSFSENPIHVFPELGEYTIRLKSKNECKSLSIYKTIEVVYVQTGIEIVSDNKIHVYPNPVNDNLTISNINQLGKNEDLHISIQTIEGITVYQEKISNEYDSETIDVRFLSNGFYILRIQTKNNEALIRFIKN